MYQGQLVDIAGDPYFTLTTPRLSAGLGVDVDIGKLEGEVMGAGGVTRTKTDYGGYGTDVSWRPWYGASISVRHPSRVGIEVEFGRHRLEERYYSQATDVVVAAFLRWETMFRISAVVPILTR